MDNERLANVKSFEAKLTLNYEEVDINGEVLKQYVYVGGAIAGTAVLHKTDSKVLNKVSGGIKSQIMPDITIIAKVTDPAVVGSQRVKLTDVVFDEVMLANFENAKITEESVPFKAGGYEVLDTIIEE